MIATGAGLQNARFRHIRSLGWDFMGRVRSNIQLRLQEKGEQWLKKNNYLWQKERLNIWGRAHWHGLNMLNVMATFTS